MNMTWHYGGTLRAAEQAYFQRLGRSPRSLVADSFAVDSLTSSHITYVFSGFCSKDYYLLRVCLMTTEVCIQIIRDFESRSIKILSSVTDIFCWIGRKSSDELVRLAFAGEIVRCNDEGNSNFSPTLRREAKHPRRYAMVPCFHNNVRRDRSGRKREPRPIWSRTISAAQGRQFISVSFVPIRARGTDSISAREDSNPLGRHESAPINGAHAAKGRRHRAQRGDASRAERRAIANNL